MFNSQRHPLNLGLLISMCEQDILFFFEKNQIKFNKLFRIEHFFIDKRNYFSHYYSIKQSEMSIS